MPQNRVRINEPSSRKHCNTQPTEFCRFGRLLIQHKTDLRELAHQSRSGCGRTRQYCQFKRRKAPRRHVHLVLLASHSLIPRVPLSFTRPTSYTVFHLISLTWYLCFPVRTHKSQSFPHSYRPTASGRCFMFHDEGRSLHVQVICHKVCCCVIDNARRETHLGFFFSLSPAVTLKCPPPVLAVTPTPYFSP